MEHPKTHLLEGVRRVWVEAPDVYGTAHIARAFLDLAPEGQPYVWIHLGKGAAHDPVTIGNVFSDAMYSGLGLLLPSGMEWGVLIGLWSKQAHLFQPMTFAVTGADRGPEFTLQLMNVSSKEDRWFVAAESLDELGSQREGLTLRVSDLRLSEDDFSPYFSRQVGTAALSRAAAASEGAFERLLVLLHRHGAIPEPVRPGPHGPRLLVAKPVATSPEEALSHLVEKGSWKEALELASSHAQQKVDEVLSAGAGYDYIGRGNALGLYKILRNRVQSGDGSEETLLWLVGAAQRLGKHEELRDLVEAHLSEHEAPRLRAVYAGSLAPHERRLQEARRAAAAHEDELTLYFLGRELQDTDLLLKALRLAEKAGDTYAVIRNANALSVALSRQGRLHEGHHYKRYAYTLMRNERIADPITQLTTTNSYLYSGILLGNPDPTLFDELSAFVSQRTLGSWWRAAMTTLIQYSWVKGDLDEAQEKLDQLWDHTPRRDRPLLAPFAVHALRSWGRPEQALDLAREAHAFSQESGEYGRALANGGLGMALFGTQPEDALEYLEKACASFSNMPVAPPYELRFYHALALHSLRQEEDAQSLLRELSPLAESLHEGALSLFMPPEALPLFGRGIRLSLNFLGDHQAFLGGAPLNLRRSYSEVLTLLALHPSGLSLGELAAYYRDSISLSTVKSILSRLREIVPLASKPYRIAVEWDADFVRLVDLVRSGKVLQALELYRGPLLPGSTSPGVEEQRMVTEETLRAAVLDRGDGPLVFSLAERLADDLEVWEAARDRLLPGDSRRVIAEAQVRRLQRDYGLD